ncbi:MAG: hypothetical protein HY822_01930 [Acidobacteria bacterium]|nr:hypothetical protein [Acidobacteriota bacterium]
MSDTQMLIIALATVPTMIVVLAGTLLNNSRLTDVKELIRAEIHSLESKVEKNHSEMLFRFADLDNRLSRIEGLLNVK